jgi:FSR family fosmidomycin resistance protein-like MFS transporter
VSLIRNRSFLVNAVAHGVVDMINSQRSMLLAVLSVPLGLTNAMIGLIGAAYTFSGSLSQPLFGLLADKIGSRWVVVSGVLWLTVMFGLALVLPGHAALAVLVLAALGSAAFHPAGTMEATLLGRSQPLNREATAASIFFLFGQGGYSLGPAIGGALLDRWGPAGLLLLLLVAFPTGFYAGSVNRRPAEEPSDAEKPASSLVENPIVRQSMVAFVLLIALRSWAQMNMINYIPKFFSDLGYRPSQYGMIATTYGIGTALGGVAGGVLADRFGKKRVILLSMVLSAVMLATFPSAAQSPMVFLVAPLVGAFTGAPHGILVVLAQHMLPGRVGAASGLVLGFTFASGAVGALISGLQADLYGFTAVFLTTAVIAAAGALIALQLKTE